MKLPQALAVAVLAAGSCLSIAAPVDPVIPNGPPQVPPADKLPPPPSADEMGLSAPLLTVDRFSDRAASLLRRSLRPEMPGPGEPFSLDDPRFTIAISGPAGLTAQCYDFDVRPAVPGRYYVFYDRLNNYRLGQFPVIEKAPGDDGYSDLWDIWKVFTPDSFRETNWIRDAATVEKLLADPSSGFKGASTGIYLNAPIVPEGTTANNKAEGRAGRATMMYAWYKGERAPFLYFEGSLHLTSEGKIPVVELTSMGDRGVGPPKQLQASAWPKAPGYSPLARVVGPRGEPVLNGLLNCPIVGTATP